MTIFIKVNIVVSDDYDGEDKLSQKICFKFMMISQTNK